MQSDDGNPHYAFFDKDTQLSFVWDGQAEYVEVSHGGYGEPVTDTFKVPTNVHTFDESALHWLLWFQAACITYIVLKGKE